MHGGSGSLVVEEAEEAEEAEVTEAADKEESHWIGEEDLGSFEMNVPMEPNKPAKNHVVCCTGNSTIQVDDSSGMNCRRSCCRWAFSCCRRPSVQSPR